MSFRSAGDVLAGVKLMHMIRKGQFTIDSAAVMSFADQFYSLEDESAQCKWSMLSTGNPCPAQQCDRT